jgi:hypothetical protein
MQIKSTLVTFALLLLAPSAFAENAVDATDKPEAKRNVRVIYHGAPANAPEKAFLYGASGKFAPVDLRRYEVTENIALPDNGEQFILLPKMLPADKPAPANAPKVTIPVDWDLCVLLVITDPSNKTFPIRIQPVNASASVFAPGEIYWVNLSEIAVGGKVGEQNLLLKPKTTVLMPAPKKEKGDFYVKLDSLTRGEEKSRWFVRKSWRHNARTRQIVFVIPKDPPELAALYVVSFYE